MNAEQRLNWARDELLRAMQENLRGSVTFHFNNGILEGCQKTSNKKVNIDEDEK